MGLTKVESEVQALLAETIIALCRNTLKFETHVSVQGLLGVTLDNQEIFLLNIEESIDVPHDSEKGTKRLHLRESDGDSVETNEVNSPRKRRRKRHRPRQITEADQSKENDSDSDCVEFVSSVSKANLENNCAVTKIKTEAPDVDNDVHENTSDNFLKIVNSVKSEECHSIDNELPCSINGNISNNINGQDSLIGNISNLQEVFVPDPLSFDYYSNHFRYHSFPTHPLLASLYSAQVFGELTQEPEPPQQAENVSPRKDCRASNSERKSKVNSASSSNRLNNSSSLPVTSPDFSLHFGPQDSAEQQRTCHLCNKMFPSRSHRAVHMRTHTGERPFQCPLCGKDFNQRQVMYRHMRNIHHVHPESTRTFMNRRRNSQANSDAVAFLRPAGADR